MSFLWRTSQRPASADNAKDSSSATSPPTPANKAPAQLDDSLLTQGQYQEQIQNNDTILSRPSLTASSGSTMQGSLPPPPPQSPATTTTSPAFKAEEEEDSALFSARSGKQFLLFSTGMAFLTLSTVITRRHVLRRLHPASLPTFHPSNAPPPSKVNGPIEALEALQLATLNVTAFAITLVGGLSWGFNVSTIDELRRKVRGGLGADGTGRNQQELEEEWEEWIASMLARKELKERVKSDIYGAPRGAGPVHGIKSTMEGQRMVVDERGRDRRLDPEGELD